MSSFILSDEKQKPTLVRATPRPHERDFGVYTVAAYIYIYIRTHRVSLSPATTAERLAGGDAGRGKRSKKKEKKKRSC